MEKKPEYLGHRARLKEKYLNSGFQGWLSHEIIEYVLSFAIARKDTKPIAKQLLAKYKTISAIIDADIEELMQVKGISQHTALFIKMTKDISGIYLKDNLCEKNLISSPSAVSEYLRCMLAAKKEENIYALFLNKSNKLLAAETLHVGTVDSSVVYPRTAVERALKHNATGLIIAHNHPGGSLKPSQEDISVTAAIKVALETVNVALVDHVVVTKEGYYSFKENDLL